MTTELHDRLSDLAAHTPPASPPGDLWARGVRRRRLMRATSGVLVVALVALLGLGGWSWREERPVQPAGSSGAARVPDRLFQPSSWLPSFDSPPGRLIAVIPAGRSTWWHGQQNGFVGVTASTGSYGFLALPRAVTDFLVRQPVALSPDGRRLAVWVTGKVSGRPISTVVGLDVYDLDTGAISRWRRPTVHGIDPGELMWAGNDTLLINFAQWAKGTRENGYANHGATYRWNLPSGSPSPLPKRLQAANLSVTGHLVVALGYRALRIADLDDASASTTVTGMPRHQVPLVNPSGTRIVAQQGTREAPTLVAGRVPSGGGAVLDRRVLHVTGTARLYSVQGWVDDDHVVAQVMTSGSDPQGALAVIDVRTGVSRSLISPFVTAQTAIDLLGAPVVHATAPPTPHDPRLVLGGLLVLSVLVGLTLRRVARGCRP